jgi:hypothetical protein
MQMLSGYRTKALLFAIANNTEDQQSYADKARNGGDSG